MAEWLAELLASLYSLATLQKLDEREFRRILLIKPSSLGDVVHALPVLHGLRVRFPSAHISWLVSRDFRALIEGHPEVDEIIEFDRRRLGQAYFRPRSLWDLLWFLYGLRRARFDLVIDLQGLFRSGFFARVTGARVRIGAGRIREGASWFYNARTPPPSDGTHAVDANWEVARLLGFERAAKQFNLAVTAGERARARQLLSEVGVSEDQEFVAVLPGARWETKRWLPRHFVDLIDSLHEAGRSVVLMGSGAESDLCRLISDACKRQPAGLAGRTSLRELTAVLEKAGHVICNDSAPMHIAAALGRPLTAIFGPTNPDRTGPYSGNALVIRLPLECSPCYLRTIVECPYQHRCMTDLNAVQVLHSLQMPVRN